MNTELLTQLMNRVEDEIMTPYPGCPLNYMSLIVDVDGEQYMWIDRFVATNYLDAAKIVDNRLADIMLLHGVYNKNIEHQSSFITERHYPTPREIIRYTDEDYEVNAEVINYIFATMSAISNKGDKIELITYSEDSGLSNLVEFKTIDELVAYLNEILGD